MPLFPGAVQRPISGASGSYTGGPFKIVHHTTEGSSARGAFDAYRANRSDPHFTVDETTIFQHIDTGVAARALKNPAGGVQTNRDSAIQIEVVGFAHRAKSRATLRNVARLCRWIEATHNVPQQWPNGFPKPADSNGRDPGGHNRNARNWDTKGGHYGHSTVPENDHWDPGYTEVEINFLMTFTADADFDAQSASEFDGIPETDPGLADDVSRMPDHSEVSPQPIITGRPRATVLDLAGSQDVLSDDAGGGASTALAAKVALRAHLPLEQDMLQLDGALLDSGDPSADVAADFAEGRFEGLENIRLRWVRPNWFEFIPKATNPFCFVRANGERVEPRRMFTDGGSIPRLVRWGSDLDPWGFAPAFLVHDYEFDLHHCGRSTKSFEDVRDTMMEAVRTLMAIGLCPSSSIVSGMIYLGINSPIARRLWRAEPPSCPLPPDSSE